MIPRVTQILKAGGLIDDRWYNKEGRDRGTEIHIFTQLIDKGWMIEDDFPDVYRGYLSAYKKFLSENDVKVIESEYKVVYEGNYPYVGHIDRIMVVNGDDYIVDIKTGQVVRWNGYQLAAYGWAFNVNFKRAILQLTKDGKYRFKTKIKIDLSSDYWLRQWTHYLKKYYEEGKK